MQVFDGSLVIAAPARVARKMVVNLWMVGRYVQDPAIQRFSLANLPILLQDRSRFDIERHIFRIILEQAAILTYPRPGLGMATPDGLSYLVGAKGLLPPTREHLSMSLLEHEISALDGVLEVQPVVELRDRYSAGHAAVHTVADSSQTVLVAHGKQG